MGSYGFGCLFRDESIVSDEFLIQSEFFQSAVCHAACGRKNDSGTVFDRLPLCIDQTFGGGEDDFFTAYITVVFRKLTAFGDTVTQYGQTKRKAHFVSPYLSLHRFGGGDFEHSKNVGNDGSGRKTKCQTCLRQTFVIIVNAAGIIELMEQGGDIKNITCDS